MIVGSVLIGGILGLATSVIALIFGASFGTAFSLYVLVGAATLLLLPLALVLFSGTSDRSRNLKSGLIVDP